MNYVNLMFSRVIEEAIFDEDAEIIAETFDHISDDDQFEHVNTSTKISKPKKKTAIQEKEPQFDASEWKLEINRVTPLLKIHITNDNKDWRLHLSQLQKHLFV